MGGWCHGNRKECPCVLEAQGCHSNQHSWFPGDRPEFWAQGDNLPRKGERQRGVPVTPHLHWEGRMGTHFFPYCVCVGGEGQIPAGGCPRTCSGPGFKQFLALFPPQGPHTGCSLCVEDSAFFLANSSA